MVPGCAMQGGLDGREYLLLQGPRREQDGRPTGQASAPARADPGRRTSPEEEGEAASVPAYAALPEVFNWRWLDTIPTKS